MKITMLSMGSTGDVLPYIILGKELASRGHRITLAAFPEFRGPVEEAGLSFFPLDGDAEQMIGEIMKPDTNGITYLPRLMRNLRSVLDALIRSLCESCRGADAMVCNFFGSVYYSVAEKYGIPCVQTHFFPMDPNRETPISSFRSQRLGPAWNRLSYVVGYRLIGLVEKHYLSPWRKENGLSLRAVRGRPDYTAGSRRIPVVYAISPALFPRPAEWGPEIHMSGFWFDEHRLPARPEEELVSFLAQGEAPVYIGFGSMNTGDMDRLMAIVLRAVHLSGVRAVIHLGWSGKRYPSSGRVFFAEFLPHEWLFSRVSAVIHHGGAGTTSAGLREGRPTLIIPFAGDQPFWGDRVWKSGCGPKPLKRKGLTAEKLAERIRDLVSNKQYKTAARNVAAQLREEHGASRAADLIEKEITGR